MIVLVHLFKQTLAIVLISGGRLLGKRSRSEKKEAKSCKQTNKQYKKKKNETSSSMSVFREQNLHPSL